MEMRTRTRDDERPEEAPVLAIYIGATRSQFWGVAILGFLIGVLTIGALGVLTLRDLVDAVHQIERAMR